MAEIAEHTHPQPWRQVNAEPTEIAFAGRRGLLFGDGFATCGLILLCGF